MLFLPCSVTSLRLFLLWECCIQSLSVCVVHHSVEEIVQTSYRTRKGMLNPVSQKSLGGRKRSTHTKTVVELASARHVGCTLTQLSCGHSCYFVSIVARMHCFLMECRHYCEQSELT